MTNPRVLVTAGASGIGYAIASCFSNSGAEIHIADIDGEAVELAKQAIPFSSAAFSVADVSDESAVAEMFSKQDKHFGGIDVLVNCAGIKGPTGATEDLLLSDWQRCLEVNLQSTFLCSKHAIPFLKSQGSGCIINLSSTAGWHGYPLRSPYAAAKWGIIGLTKSMAMELGVHGIRVNAICPGSVSGDRMDRVISEEAKKTGTSESDIRRMYTKGSSMRCFIEAEDIAQTAFFLASEGAKRITGQAISVDGHLESFGGID